NGNFDDAQRGVKCAFADGTLAASLAQKGETLSSANSINWGRLVPQIVYYFYSYAQLVAQKEITSGSAVSFCVPTGNFGDILAGYYAKQMGLPIDKLI
ncbi:MAG: threonine synthase, partial [Ruthenibacterium sp.]